MWPLADPHEIKYFIRALSVPNCSQENSDGTQMLLCEVVLKLAENAIIKILYRRNYRGLTMKVGVITSDTKH